MASVYELDHKGKTILCLDIAGCCTSRAEYPSVSSKISSHYYECYKHRI